MVCGVVENSTVQSVSAPILYLEAGAGGCVVNCLRNYTFKQVKPIWKNIQGNFESPCGLFSSEYSENISSDDLLGF